MRSVLALLAAALLFAPTISTAQQAGFDAESAFGGRSSSFPDAVKELQGTWYVHESRMDNDRYQVLKGVQACHVVTVESMTVRFTLRDPLGKTEIAAKFLITHTENLPDCVALHGEVTGGDIDESNPKKVVAYTSLNARGNLFATPLMDAADPKYKGLTDCLENGKGYDGMVYWLKKSKPEFARDELARLAKKRADWIAKEIVKQYGGGTDIVAQVSNASYDPIDDKLTIDLAVSFNGIVSFEKNYQFTGRLTSKLNGKDGEFARTGANANLQEWFSQAKGLAVAGAILKVVAESNK